MGYDQYTVPDTVAFERTFIAFLLVSGKTVAKSLADGVVQLAVLCFCIRRIVHDSATVIFFLSQRMNNHIIHLLSPRFLVVAFFVVRAEFQTAT